MKDIIVSIIYGIVEGITEWLPVSSTGHMILLERFLKFSLSKEFMDMYLIVIQLGAILAVVVMYFKDLWPFTADKEKKFIKKDTWIMWFKILVSCIPAVIVGVLFDDKLEELFYNYQTVSVMLILVGIVFIVVENRGKGKKAAVTSIKDISFKTAFWIGMFQLVAAVFPGTSRSGATIIGGLILGLGRQVAAEYTFFLAVPVMIGASLLKLVKFFGGGGSFAAGEASVLITGMVTAFIVSILVIRFFMGYIKKHDFKVFGWYRIVLGLVVLLTFTFLLP